MIPNLIDFFLTIDKHLPLIVQEYGFFTYAILFFIIFLETGFVVTPYLPGDSLLFVAGVCAASGILSVEWLLGVFILGAVLGDTANYWIGSYCGTKVFQKYFCNIFKDEHFQRTRIYFDRYGGSTIFIARFIPIVRTFAPFLAGVGTMQYRRFLLYNMAGGIVWSCVFVLAGYYFGTLPFVKENLNLLIYGVVFVTLVSVIFIIYTIIVQLRKTKAVPVNSTQQQTENK